MTQSNILKQYIFPNRLFSAGSLHLNFYTDEVINGTIINIDADSNTMFAAGSLIVLVSGTNEKLFAKTQLAGFVFPFFPEVFPVNNSNNTTSPHISLKRVVNDVLQISGGAFLIGNHVSGLKINYI